MGIAGLFNLTTNSPSQILVRLSLQSLYTNLLLSLEEETFHEREIEIQVAEIARP